MEKNVIVNFKLLAMNVIRVKLTCLLILISVGISPSLAQSEEEKATITGWVLDKETGKPLSEAGVEALSNVGDGSSHFALTNKEGFFILEIVPGSWLLKITYPNYETAVVKDIKTAGGEKTEHKIYLTAGMVQIDELKVVGKPKGDVEFVQIMKRKIASNIVDNISAQAMSRIPESDVAGILTRMPGVVMDEGKYMQARGMPKRYNRSTLNGTNTPTTRPNEKVTPLDLFPAGVVESISVVKTFTPDLPGNFSGGLCQITTKSIPDKLMLSFSTSTKFNDATTNQKYLTYRGGARDWLGYDDGTRGLPGIIPDEKLVRWSKLSKTGFDPYDMERFGESFNNIWNIKRKKAAPQNDFSFYIGERFNKLGAVLSLYHKSNIQNKKDEKQIAYTMSTGSEKELIPLNSYHFTSSKQSRDLGGLLSFGLELDTDHKIGISNFYNRTANDEARIYQGYNDDQSTNIRVTRLRYQTEELLSSTLSGDHKIESLLDSSIKWRFNYSFANLDDPDMRQSIYIQNPITRQFTLSDDTEALLRMFTKQEEDSKDMALDWGLTLPETTWLTPKLKIGTAYTYRDRDFRSRRFAFVPRDKSRINMSADVESILQPYNINPYEIEIKETTRSTDAYSAQESLLAYYGMLELNLFERFQLIGGARFERDHTRVNTFDLFEPSDKVITKLYEDKWLPSIQLKYSLLDNMNVRLGYSETVSRPEFHELAPFEFTDVIGGHAIRGNPDLKVASIKNYDFRWEWFLSDEDVIAVSYFYKDIKNAIEPTVQLTTQLRSSYTNAEKAYLQGVEFELRKNLEFISPWLRYVNFSTNYIFSDSETEILPSTLFVPTTLKRPLVGQPEHVVNAAIEYDNRNIGLVVRFMYKFTDERVYEIGGAGLPDIMIDSDQSFDFVLIKNFWKNFQFKFRAQNLSDESTVYSQLGKVQHAYKEGRTFKIDLSYKW